MPHLETVKRAKRPEHLPDVFTVQEAKDSLEADGEAARQFRRQSVVLSDGAIHAGQRQSGDRIQVDGGWVRNMRFDKRT